MGSNTSVSSQILHHKQTKNILLSRITVLKWSKDSRCCNLNQFWWVWSFKDSSSTVKNLWETEWMDDNGSRGIINADKQALFDFRSSSDCRWWVTYSPTLYTAPMLIRRAQTDDDDDHVHPHGLSRWALGFIPKLLSHKTLPEAPSRPVHFTTGLEERVTH